MYVKPSVYGQSENLDAGCAFPGLRQGTVFAKRVAASGPVSSWVSAPLAGVVGSGSGRTEEAGRRGVSPGSNSKRFLSRSLAGGLPGRQQSTARGSERILRIYRQRLHRI
jgi:hypothetical protein